MITSVHTVLIGTKCPASYTTADALNLSLIHILKAIGIGGIVYLIILSIQMILNIICEEHMNQELSLF